MKIKVFLFFVLLFAQDLIGQSIDSLLDEYSKYTITTPKESRLKTLEAINAYYLDNQEWQNLIFNSKKVLGLAATDSTILIGDTYFNMATAYYRLKMNDKAEKKIPEAFVIYKKNKNKEGMFKCLIALGITEQEKGNNKKALDYYKQAEKIDSLSKDNKTMLMHNIAVAYDAKGDYKQAINYMLKVLELDKSNTPIDSNIIATDYNNIAATYININDNERGIAYLDIALTYAKSPKKQALIFDNYTLAYLNLNNPVKAKQYLDKYKGAKQAEYTENLSAKIDEIEHAYEIEREYITEKAAQEKRIKQTQTWLIIAIFSAIILVVLALLLVLNNNRKLYKSNLDKVLLEQQLLRTQMNPHFTFNTLSNIHSLILRKDTKNSATMLKRFSSLMRTMLENASESWVSIASELKGVEDYIKIQELRFKKPIDYQVRTESVDKELLIPPMCIQPFVENAIEHGIRETESPVISIYIKQAKKTLRITIEDNGVGFKNGIKKQQDKKSMSIDINNKRLHILAKQMNVDAFVKLEERQPTGTRVILSLPFKTEE